MTTNNQTSPEDSLALWYIENPNSGTPFGLYAAGTREEALDLCAQDSGYADYTDACEQTSSAAELRAREASPMVYRRWLSRHLVAMASDFRMFGHPELNAMIDLAQRVEDLERQVVDPVTAAWLDSAADKEVQA